MKLLKFKEGDDAKIFMITIEKLLQTATNEEKAVQFLACVETEAMNRIKGEIGEDWDFANMRKVFVAEFMDKILVTRSKAEFMNIKILKNEALTDFANRFYKAAQNLKFNNSLDLIDAKNAMEQALEPYQELAIACASPLADAINLKEFVNLINRQSKNFSQLNPARSTFPSLSLLSSNYEKVYTVDKETCKQFGSLI